MQADEQRFLAIQEQRNRLARNDPRHAELGPEEHRLFTKGVISENPLAAIPMAAMIPAYTAAKYIAQNPGANAALMQTNPLMGEIMNALIKYKKINQSRSPASMQEMGSAYRGLWQGLLAGFSGE